MAAVLSMTADEKIPEYINICENKIGIKIMPPDINISGNDFTPHDNKILYGLTAVKSVGETSIPDLIKYAPYKSIEDAIQRLPKKSFNKRIAESLIKAGAFDFEDKNRNKLLNRLHKLRKDKKAEVLDEDKYNEETAMRYEEESLGAHISFHTWWENMKAGESITLNGASVKDVTERTDKKGNMMAFVQITYKKVTVKGIVFASKYSKLAGLLDRRLFSRVVINGKKDERGTFIVNDATPYIKPLKNNKEEMAG